MNHETKEYKSDRILALFFRVLKGEALSVRSLADEYHVSTRSITRDITSLKAFLAEHRDILGNAELEYSSTNHTYTLYMDNLISNKELFAIAKVLIGSNAFSNKELLNIISKLKSHTTSGDRRKLETLINKELYHYTELKTDCNSVIDNIWTLTEYITTKRAITIFYYKMDRSYVRYKIKPLSIMFSEYYFYLVAYKYDEKCNVTPKDNSLLVPHYFRIDRITDMVAHREYFELTSSGAFDEGLLRKQSQFMWPGPLRHIRFEFSGPSVQAIMDRIPTARIIDMREGTYIIEAKVYGDGIKMFLLSQGSWVKVLAPDDFVLDMKNEIGKMNEKYIEEDVKHI